MPEPEEQAHSAELELRKLHVIEPQPGAAVNQNPRGAVQFDLQTRPIVSQWREAIRVNVYPQDPFVDEPVLRFMHAQEMRAGLVNERFSVRDSRGIIARPNAHGDYLFHPYQPEFDQINTMYYANLALRMCEHYAGRSLPWSFGMSQILLDPCVGSTEANAFYHENERLIGFFTFKVSGKEIRAAQSSDIVAHEVGHAILDGMRDLLNVSFSFGPEAFHEAFCDTIAILVALHDNGLIERVLAETKGKLNTESFLSFLAEDLGSHHNAKDPRTANVFYLRNALNSLRVQPFDKLPYLPDNRVTGLGREAHSYSRIYTGALYDILVGIYDHLKKQKWSEASALAMARDVLGELLIRSVELGPIGESSLEDFAWAMVMADRIFTDGAYQKIIIREFRWRRIFTTKNLKSFEEQAERLPDLMLSEAVIDPQSALRLLEMNRGELRLPDGEEFTVQSGYRDRFDNRFITFKTRRLVKLEGTQFGRYAGATVPLYGGVVMMFDRSGMLRHYLYRPADEEDVTQAHQQIADMLEHGHLAFSAMVGPDGSGMLERTAIITVGTDDRPTNRTLNKIEPGFAPQKKKLQIPMLDQALGVVRVSMQVMGQPKIKDYAEQWLRALKRANGNSHR